MPFGFNKQKPNSELTRFYNELYPQGQKSINQVKKHLRFVLGSHGTDDDHLKLYVYCKTHFLVNKTGFNEIVRGVRIMHDYVNDDLLAKRAVAYAIITSNPSVLAADWSKDQLIEMLDGVVNEYAIIDRYKEENKDRNHQPFDSEDGLTIMKPMFFNGVKAAENYLASLQDKDGTQLCVGSRQAFNTKNGMPIDCYQMNYPNGKNYGKLYVSVYGSDDYPYVPDGYSRRSSNADTHDTAGSRTVNPFTSQSAKEYISKISKATPAIADSSAPAGSSAPVVKNEAKNKNAINSVDTGSSNTADPVNDALKSADLPMKNKDSQAEPVSVQTDKEYPMRFHSLVTVVMFLRIFYNMLYGFLAFTGYTWNYVVKIESDLIYKAYPTIRIIDITYGIVLIALAIAALVISIPLKHRYHNAPNYLLTYFLAEIAVIIGYPAAINLALPKGNYIATAGKLFTYFVAAMIAYFLLYAYYYKRGHMFQDTDVRFFWTRGTKRTEAKPTEFVQQSRKETGITKATTTNASVRSAEILPSREIIVRQLFTILGNDGSDEEHLKLYNAEREKLGKGKTSSNTIIKSILDNYPFVKDENTAARIAAYVKLSLINGSISSSWSDEELLKRLDEEGKRIKAVSVPLSAPVKTQKPVSSPAAAGSKAKQDSSVKTNQQTPVAGTVQPSRNSANAADKTAVPITAKNNTKKNEYWRNSLGEIFCPGDDCPIQKCGDDCPIWNNTIAASLFQIGKYENAIEELQKAVKTAPDFKDAWVNLGGCYGMLTRYQDAYSAYLKAYELDHEYINAVFGLALSCKDLGKYEESLKWCSAYKKLCSDGQLDKAEAEAKKALEAEKQKKTVLPEKTDDEKYGEAFALTLDRNTFEEGYHELLGLEKSGYSEAAIALAQIYHDNPGVSRKHYEVAAKAGIAEGCWGFANHIKHNRIPVVGNENDELWVKYLKKAAEGGCPDAMLELGNVYSRLGQYIHSNYWNNMAYFYEHKQAGPSVSELPKKWKEAGCPEDTIHDLNYSQYNDSLLLLRMMAAVNPNESFAEMQRSALNGGHVLSAYVAARVAEERNNEETAVKFYGIAAKDGDIMASRIMGDFFFTGKGGVEQNTARAEELFHYAAERGEKNSCFVMGEFERNSTNGSDDLALFWYAKAHVRGMELAKQRIKQMRDAEKSSKEEHWTA